ncbi:cyclin-domain-containing protein [Armillaria novae-zelandiae]|uniref:Cyclin-domain-containing protein n=1 Tax=Armillaria novae-zelandiae TaxID=153914 RepID=A0AA39P309_9AGAR|nr:cyclin-domain-containing protein [Armillaria novae-zelandiae]
MLERLMAHNDRIALLPQALTRFHSRSAPSISVGDYLRRITRFINVERSCLLVSLCYIDAICARHPLFTLSSLTCHRFLITAIAVASKCLCDSFCTNALYARVGGISLTELNILEREFLHMIDWRLMVSPPSLPRWTLIHPVHARDPLRVLHQPRQDKRFRHIRHRRRRLPHACPAPQATRPTPRNRTASHHRAKYGLCGSSERRGVE